MLGLADPRDIYHADAELLALWRAYFNLKNKPQTPIENTNDIDSQVAACERILG
ncbi:hypothetical protein [Neptunomonas japonica]|uniref:hypothetical protein n=1 Tax=Neptunomonas japonica TaxID=417574 RepID=UPI000409600B|nr:hypothetical protein [Neptunomonas japonica]